MLCFIVLEYRPKTMHARFDNPLLNDVNPNLKPNSASEILLTSSAIHCDGPLDSGPSACNHFSFSQMLYMYVTWFGLVYFIQTGMYRYLSLNGNIFYLLQCYMNNFLALSLENNHPGKHIVISLLILAIWKGRYHALLLNFVSTNTV